MQLLFYMLLCFISIHLDVQISIHIKDYLCRNTLTSKFTQAIGRTIYEMTILFGNGYQMIMNMHFLSLHFGAL